MPTTGTTYRVVGAADDVYFARAERIAEILKSEFSLGSDDIDIQMKDPGEWDGWLAKTCEVGGANEQE